MEFDDPELLAEFVTESREHLADVEGQLLEIEAGGANIDVDLVNTVFRAVHSIKGAAGFMGLTTLSKLAHSLENVLGKIRTCDLVPTTAIVDVMLRGADELTGLINDIENSNGVDVTAHIEVLDSIFEGTFNPSEAATSDSTESLSTNKEADIKPEITESEPGAEEVETHNSNHDDVVEEKQAAPVTSGHSKANSNGKAAANPAANTEDAKATSSQAANAPNETSIRVQIGVLDSLMNLAGELVLGRNQLLQTVNSTDQSGIEGVASRLDQVTSELQEAIMQTRMQPIGNVFAKFPRVIRDLSARLGKQCDITMEGKDVEVDKTIVEAIGDPLTHLIRNSVDHGLETPDVRIAAGKKATGSVFLRAYHQAGQVRIDIVDDGAGIDPEKLRQKALNNGLITQERADAMSARDCVRLIFHPGFSTAETISDVSGRGVGMDVVRTNIEKLGGTVDVESEVGTGTSIRITLPLTLAIIPSMLIRCRGERFAIPQVNIVELVRVRASELSKRISRVKDAQVLRLRGSLLPLVELDSALGIKGPSDNECLDNEARHIIVVETGQTRYGLVVHEIDDSEEIVVKPLGRHLKNCNCMAGATILGDGHVAPILDVSGISTLANLNSSNNDELGEEIAQDASSNGERQSMLLFSNCPGEYFAIPMALIARIERIRSEQVDSIGGQALLQYRGSTLPLLSVEQCIEARPRMETNNVYVVVFNINGREIGLIAPQLNDIREVNVNIDTDTFRELGVAGSMVIEERTTRFLSLFELAEIAHPDWFEQSSDETVSSVQKEETVTLMLVEDSPFFRMQVKQYLEGAGYATVCCEDGQHGWDELTSGNHKVDLVITDIEMPNMNGFELSRKIKQDPRTSHIPIIALTSLASEEDRQRGLESGVDDYQVKLDKEKVITAVTQLTGRAPGRGSSNQANSTNQQQEGCLV